MKVTASPLMKCVKCEELYTYNGFTICREEDRRVDHLTLEPVGRTYVFYTVCDEEMILESFKTLREAQRYLDALENRTHTI